MNRILDLESPDDPKVKILLQDQDEVEMGINMAAVITKALMYSSQALPKKSAVADPLPGMLLFKEINNYFLYIFKFHNFLSKDKKIGLFYVLKLVQYFYERKEDNLSL